MQDNINNINIKYIIYCLNIHLYKYKNVLIAQKMIVALILMGLIYKIF